MSQFQHICFLSLFMMCVIVGYGQENPTFKPYTIETTYEKLKKDYPFIEPIKPLVSNKIKAKENLVYKKINNTKLRADVYLPNKN